MTNEILKKCILHSKSVSYCYPYYLPDELTVHNWEVSVFSSGLTDTRSVEPPPSISAI